MYICIQRFLVMDSRRSLMRLLIGVVIAVAALVGSASVACAQERTVTVTGKIVDARNNKALADVSVAIDGTNIATVSNSDGNFVMIAPYGESAKVSFSTKGYSGVTVPLDSLMDISCIIKMRRQGVELGQVTVYPVNPEEIVAEAFSKIADNYSATKDMLALFYRETIRKGNRFIGVSEAAIDVLKSPYSNRDIAGDRVRINRGRRLLSQRNSDTIAVKILGGPNLALGLDFVKNADFLFNESELSDYEFKMEKPEYIDDRIQYVISFRPRYRRQEVQFCGKLFIDRESVAFTRAEFEMDPSDKAAMTSAILYRKPRGLRFSPQKIEFVVAYRQMGGKTYLSYIRNVMRFKCEMKRRLFASAYTVYSEMVVVDRDEATDMRIDRKSTFRPGQIFYDIADRYWDGDYWADYNIIPPTESLENAVSKLRKTATAIPMK